MTDTNAQPGLDYLFDAATVRERCGRVRELANVGELKHWQLDSSKLPATADYVLKLIRANYPDLDVPYHGRWRHIDCGDVSRVANLAEELHGNQEDKARALLEMTLVSVLLDAGAGMSWHYQEASTGQTWSKSEGLAVAAYDMYRNGAFAGLESDKLTVSALGLKTVSDEKLATGFQVSAGNPLVGVTGRVKLLNRLGDLVANKHTGFASGKRLGELYDAITLHAENKKISAKSILKQLLISLGPIWPARMTLQGHNLGDTWRHYALENESKLPGYIPFHKLSQWLSYSLLEVFEFAGYQITDLDDLTGLPEYRNGGLFTDMEVLLPKNKEDMHKVWQASDEFLVEWRALTVNLLDDVATLIRQQLQMTAEQLPLAKILQGGTWLAGRMLANEKRSDGGPPFAIQSDGTVF